MTESMPSVSPSEKKSEPSPARTDVWQPPRIMIRTSSTAGRANHAHWALVSGALNSGYRPHMIWAP